MGDEFAIAHLAGQIALCPHGQAPLQPNVANPVVIWNQVRYSIGAVINDNQLFFGIILSQEVPD